MHADRFATADAAIQSTRRGRFLSEMERVLPWNDLLSLIEPHYIANDDVCPLPHIEHMLRIHFLQQWFNLSDQAMVDELHDSRSIRLFSGLGALDAVPDDAAMRRFRRVLKDNRLLSKLLAQRTRITGEERRHAGCHHYDRTGIAWSHGAGRSRSGASH
jgi:IS5 family transposase